MIRLRVPGILLLLILLAVLPLDAQDDPDFLSDISSVRVDDKPLDAVAFSPNGAFVASGGRDALVRVWEIDVLENGVPALLLEGHEGRITSLAYSPDGTRLASAGDDGTVRLWDSGSGSLLHSFDHHSNAAMSVTFSPDGALLASGGRDAQVVLIDSVSGDTLMTLDTFEQPVWALAFDPISGDLATALEDGSVWMWGMGDAPSLRQFSGHIGPVMSLTISADGEMLVSGGMDGLIRVWEIGADDEPLVLGGHLAPVTGVRFSEDGLLASVSLDGTVRAWDIDAGSELGFITWNNLPLTALGGYDRWLAVVGTEGVLSFWELTPPANDPPVTVVQANPQQQTVTQTTVQQQQPAQQVNQPPEQQSPAPQYDTSSGTHISIPVANINSPLTSFPLDGVSWAIDPWEPFVGYMQGTAWFNDRGNTVLGGHSEYPNGNPGIFYNLYDVSVGDVIFTYEDGIERQYVVVDIRTVHYTDLTVLYPTTHSRLTLITCDVPSFDAVSNVYYERLVVIADEVGG